MADWLVAIAQASLEDTARGMLEARGFTCYQPKFRYKRITRGRRVWVQRFLYGPYMFVEMIGDFVGQYHSIISARGIRRVLVADEQPIVAREAEIARLRGTEVRGFIRVPDRDKFTVGQNVLVQSGPFTGSPGRYDGKDRWDREYMLMDLLGQTVRLELSPGCLAAAA